MPDKQYDEAKLLYEALTKSRQPLKKATLSKLARAFGLSTGTDELLARLHRLMSGLPVEDEFIALAVWMEKCKLIHKLDQEQFPASSTDEYQVPDLFAVFNYDGQEIPVLIDVKSSGKDTPLSAKFRLSARMYTKLTNYAQRVGFLLLVAWKVSGHWALFDIREMRRHESAYHIDWENAWKADLMHLLLGNVNVTPKSGVKFIFTLKDLGPTRQRARKGEIHTFRTQDVRFLDTHGKRITKMSSPQFILFIASDLETKQQWRGDLLDVTFQVSEEPVVIPAYAILPLMLFEMRAESKRPKNWYEIVKTGNYSGISYSQFYQAMREGIGTFVQYIGKIVPHQYPDFLPKQ